LEGLISSFILPNPDSWSGFGFRRWPKIFFSGRFGQRPSNVESHTKTGFLWLPSVSLAAFVVLKKDIPEAGKWVCSVLWNGLVDL
jgi:hypothetical protein